MEHPHPIIILKDVKSEELKSLVDYMYTGQVTVSQSNLDSFLKMAESLKIRGLVNHGEKQVIDHHHHGIQRGHQEERPPLVPNPDSCIPLRKRRRKLSAEFNQGSFRNDLIEQSHPIVDGPTDLSLPKQECEAFFQPVVQAVSYSTIDLTNANQSNKVFIKPKEALISPPLSVTSEGCLSGRSSNNEQASDGYAILGSEETYNINHEGPGELEHHHQPLDERMSAEASTSYRNNIPSDDEDGEHYNQESEVGTPMVRSGICSVCGCFRSDLRQHMDSHSGQSFQCHICGRAYPRRKTLNQHIKRSHPSLIPDTNGVPI